MKRIVQKLLSILLAFALILSFVELMPIAKAEVSYAVGDIIELGMYPQTKETDTDIVNELNARAFEEDWISYRYYSNNIPGDWMTYCDITLSGMKYRGVQFSRYRPLYTADSAAYESDLTVHYNNSWQDNNGYNTNIVYWFKWEPVRWRILDPENGLVMSELVLDTQAFQPTYYYDSTSDEYYHDDSLQAYANDYESSAIRNWLINTFYRTAFSASERIAILDTVLDNSAWPESAFEYNGAPTTDKVFLLSYQDLLKSEYGFSGAPRSENMSRSTKGTDYALCQGAVKSNAYTDYHDHVAWWLRTAAFDFSSCYSVYVEIDGVLIGDLGIVKQYPDNACSKGVRPAMRVDLQYMDGIGEEQYILRHTAFAQNTTMPEQFGFYNKIWNEENGRRLGWVKTWEVVGDIGEIMTFNFDDLEISADYYDLFLSDIILKMTEKRTAEFETKAFDLFKEYHGKIKKALRNTEEWQKSVIDGSTVDLEIDSILLDPDFKLSGNTNMVFTKILGDFYTNHEDTFKEIFSGLNNAADICEGISASSDIIQAFLEAYNVYTVALAYQQINLEFFTIMYRVANQMHNQQYANWFRSALDKYFIIATNGSALYEFTRSLYDEMSSITFDLFAKDVVKNLTYNWVADMLGCSAGSVSIVAFTYSTTYGLLDKICGLDKKTKSYEIMNYIAPVEQAMSIIEDDYANILIGSQTLESAQNYCFFYQLYKAVNLYLYQAAYNFTSATKFRSNKANELEVLTMCTDQWKKSSCHTGLSAATVRKYSSVQCPVDVYVYDADGNTLLEIENEQILSCDDSLSALCFDGKKSMIYPADQNYTISIVAREVGEMSYYVSEIEENSSLRQIDFYDIPIIENQVFTGAIPESFNVAAEAYALCSDDETVTDAYDSNEISCEDHTVTEWIAHFIPTCAEPGEKAGICTACGKMVYELLPISLTHGKAVLANTVDATCGMDGYTGDLICEICGDVLESGAIIAKETVEHTWDVGTVTIPPTCTEDGVRSLTCTVCGGTKTETVNKLNHKYGAWTKLNEAQHQRVCTNDPKHIDIENHTWNGGMVTTTATCTAEGVKTFTCTACGAKKTEPVSKTAHPDADNDGWCDVCNAELFSHNTGDSYEKCKYCGGTHTGIFGRIIQFFHNLMYFFKNLFH